ncbi:hypothetical protein JCM21714_2065 [Gracilibacillus boraciitolerans JCM 21714]|uniref:VWFA domain-containing protein n=1 Tax=Gracilibacillus boraciitolerans JCM 21714 TaxID=1298598 RepID=W4VI14_9BACI|nr:VWA domain-containing protein [Gracilibacillus boraciitolerans]GAE93035.1 hypothetical protein JCM21714_2065 [Gracilibacillus boraciitolerans JCM 21714]
MANALKRKEHVYQKPTINADSFDKRRFNELLKMSKGLKEIKKQGEDIPQFDQLIGDMWSSFYKNKPSLLDQEGIEMDLYNNHSIMDRMLQEDAFHDTHQFTILDDLHSALSTIGFSEKTMEWIKEKIEKDESLKQSYENMQINTTLDNKHSKEYQQAMEQFNKALSDSLKQDKNSDQLSQILTEATKEAKQTKVNMENFLGGMEAGKGQAEMKKIPPLRDQFTLAAHLKTNHKMKRIAEWTGRFKRIAQSKQKQKSKESISKSGVTTGNEIDRILPSEMLYLAIPQAKADFLRRLAEGQTLQYNSEGKSTLGKGSIILCLDQSGSMRKLDDQSKGFALALMSIAKKQKRDFALINFSDKAYNKEYPKGKISTSQMVELCNNFLDGGTNFTQPLMLSEKIINKSRFKDADIIFITDGQDNISQDFITSFNRHKEKDKFQVLSLLIGNQAKRRTVDMFSDSVFHANDFEDEEAQQIFNI